MKALTTTLFVCLLAYLPITSAQDDCTNFINSIWLQRHVQDPANQTPEQKCYFAYSGRNGMYDLGQKSDCEDNDFMRYYVLVYNGAAESGACVPSFCSKQLKDDDTLLQKLFLTNNVNVEEDEDFTLYDPSATPPRRAGYYVLVVFLTLLGAFCLLSTVIVYQRKKNPQKEIQTRAAAFVEKRLWIFKAFDMYDNGLSLYKTAGEQGQNEQISTFGLLRFFAALWVIFYHAWLLRINPVYSPPTDKGVENFMEFGLLAVEYFFLIGGFLAGYILTGKAFREGVGIRRYFSDIFHRWVRVWPGAFISIVVYWCLLMGVSNGALWHRLVGIVKTCDKTWWQKFLLIDNYFASPGPYCASYTWYLDVDFQVYFAVVFIVYVYVKKRSLGYLTALFLFLFSVIYGIVRYKHALDNGLSTFEVWYENAPARSFEIMIGLVFGFQYYEFNKHKAQKNFFALCEKHADFRYPLMALGLYMNYLGVVDRVIIVELIPREYWEIFRRIIMCLGGTFVVLPLANKQESFIRNFMNLRIFQILGKLSYGSYLFHWSIIYGLMFSSNSLPGPYSQSQIVLRALLTAVIVFVVSVPYYLMFEKPIINIESHFLKRAKENKSTKLKPASDIEMQNQQKEKQPDGQPNQHQEDEPNNIIENEIIKDQVLLIDKPAESTQQIEQKV